MSFLGDLIGTIGGEKAPAPPVKPAIRDPAVPLPNVSANSTVRLGAIAKPVYKGTIGGSASTTTASLKRKADDTLSEQAVKISKATDDPSLSNSRSQRSLKLSATDSSKDNSKMVTASSTPRNGLPHPPAPPKPASHGSYAQMLARAKEVQQTKGVSQVGVIKHQSTEKVKPSKLSEKRKEEQEKSKSIKTGNVVAPPRLQKSRDEKEPRNKTLADKKPSSKGVQNPKPPLHGPPKPAKIEYRGTLGLSGSRSKAERDSKKARRRDDYLGTDEEDNSDLDDGYGSDDSDQYSNESSDMEGGFDDIENENRLSERTAKLDDARELALENEHKRKKEEMKRRMAALAAKHKK